jgi:predicted Rossmann fold nucleotide-binding protein DprA/Smf involved in DNA uptake
MEPEASLSWLALTMTPGIAARLSARLLNEFGSPDNVFRASLTGLEALYVRGGAGILNGPSLSIVGTRRPTV